MVQYKQRYELKNTAKDALEGKYAKSILLVLINFLISWIVRLNIGIISENTIAGVYARTGSQTAAIAIYAIFEIILLFASVILNVMNAGITFYFLKLACGQPFSIRDLFYGYRTDSRKCLVIAGATALFQTVCFGPCQYLSQNYLSTRDAKWLAYTLAAIAVGLCVYVPVSLGITLSFYLMFDFPEHTGTETLMLCWRTMKGKRMRLLYLELSFLPLVLLCILTFGIGFLWLQPYMHMTYTCFFLDLMNPKQNP